MGSNFLDFGHYCSWSLVGAKSDSSFRFKNMYYDCYSQINYGLTFRCVIEASFSHHLQYET